MPSPVLCLLHGDHPQQESQGRRTDHPKVGHLQIKAVLYIWYIQSMYISLSCLVESSGISHIPFPQQDGFSLSFKGEKKCCVLSQNQVCEPGSCWDLTRIGCQIHIFSDSKGCLFLMIYFLTEVTEELSRITQLKLCEALGSGGTVLFPRD